MLLVLTVQLHVYVKIFSIPKSKKETQKLHLKCTNYKNVSDSITAG